MAAHQLEPSDAEGQGMELQMELVVPAQSTPTNYAGSRALRHHRCIGAIEPRVSLGVWAIRPDVQPLLAEACAARAPWPEVQQDQAMSQLWGGCPWARPGIGDGTHVALECLYCLGVVVPCVIGTLLFRGVLMPQRASCLETSESSRTITPSEH